MITITGKRVGSVFMNIFLHDVECHRIELNHARIEAYEIREAEQSIARKASVIKQEDVTFSR